MFLMKAGSFATRLFCTLLSYELRQILHRHSCRSSFFRIHSPSFSPFPFLHDRLLRACPVNISALVQKIMRDPTYCAWAFLTQNSRGQAKNICRSSVPPNSHHIDICIFFCCEARSILPLRTSRQLIDALRCDLWHESCCKRSAGFQANIAPLKPRIIRATAPVV